MSKELFDELLNAGVHFGHLKRKWNPNMAPYIFDEKKGIHIIDLNKTIVKLEDAQRVLKNMASSGKKILFVATKNQAKDIVTKYAEEMKMPYITERWSGGMLTNFATIRKAINKMKTIDNMGNDGTFEILSKRERLQITRTRAKLEKNFGSIADLTRLPHAVFIVDVHREHIAVSEARKLNLPTFALCDTNSDPELINFPIPANDDASKSIDTLMKYVSDAVKEGLAERDKVKAERKSKSEKKEETVEAPKAE